MRKEAKQLTYLFARYLALIILALNGLWLFYKVLTPLTVYPVLVILKIFSQASLTYSNFDYSLVPTIIFSSYSIQLSSACIAGAAFYLLVILNLTTPMSVKKRIYSLVFSLILFLFINISRIVIFSLLLSSSFSLFNISHLIFWYFLSTIIIVLIWLAEIKLFKIKDIPVCSDIKYLYKLTRK